MGVASATAIGTAVVFHMLTLLLPTVQYMYIVGVKPEPEVVFLRRVQTCMTCMDVIVNRYFGIIVRYFVNRADR